MSEHGNSCEICKKYEGRVFSIHGIDKRFPKLPPEVFKYGGLHEGCRHAFYPFIYDINKSTYGYKNIIEFSNRPFSDNEDKSKYKDPNIHYTATEDYKKIADKQFKKLNIDKINKKNEKLFKKNVIDKYNTLEEIQQITPGIMYLYQNVDSATLSPEYHLQRKATIHKKEKHLDLAIECLRKSNELMPYSKFSYLEKDYMRLVKYLKTAKRFDEAQKEENYIKQTFSYNKKEVTFIDYLKYIFNTK